MTKQTNEFDLQAAYQAAEAARETAEQTAAALGAAERKAQRERQSRTTAAWQAHLDRYDPAKLNQAVVDAEQQLRHALEETPLGAAITGYLAAIMAECRSNVLASDAVLAGATLPAGVTAIGPKQHKDAAGNVVEGWLTEWAAGTLNQAVYDVAAARVNAAEQAVRAKADAAYASVDIPEPQVYRIIAPFFEDRSDEVGATFVHFVGSPTGAVAYIDKDHPARRWYEQHEQFTVLPTYSVPTSYRDSVQHQVLNPDMYRAGMAGQPGPGADPHPRIPPSK